MKDFRRCDETHFLYLATTYLACRLAAMGGTPIHPSHIPVTDYKSLQWAMLGMHDYAWEMRLVCEDWRGRITRAKVLRGTV